MHDLLYFNMISHIIRLTLIDFCYNHILQYINAHNDLFLLSRSGTNFRIKSFNKTHTGIQMIQTIMLIK